MKKCLMVIIPDKLSNLEKKGEITERYYNPGNVFQVVHLVLTNDDALDSIDRSRIQKMVGDAELHMHQVYADKCLLIRTLGWQPRLLWRWASTGVDLARQIKPDLVRCHGNRINAFLAYCIKRELGVPVILSLHTNPDDSRKVDSGSLWRSAYNRVIDKLETFSLQCADKIIIVYKSIIPYLESRGFRNYEVIYNAVNGKAIRHKLDYSSSGCDFKILHVGRLIPGKNPINIIRAVASLSCVQLDIVGAGPLENELKNEVVHLGCSERVHFLGNRDNDELCGQMWKYDIFTAACDYSGVPKAVIEPMLVGLPMVISRPKYLGVPEYNDGCGITIVEDSEAEFIKAFSGLKTDEELRRILGNQSRAYAEDIWDPIEMERAVAVMYESYISRK